MNRYWKGLLAAAALPLAAMPALAQHGGGHGGGGHAGGGHLGGGVGHVGGYAHSYGSARPGGYVTPAYHSSYYAPRYGYGYGTGLGVGLGVGLGTGLGLGGLGYGGYGGGYGGYGGGYSSYGGYPYSTNSAYLGSPVPYSTPATSAVVGSALPVGPYGTVFPGDQPAAPNTNPTQAALPAQATSGPAYVEVRVPDGAQVWLGPTASDQAGAVRTFVSPPLEPGVDYSYVVRGQWSENGVPVTRERKVAVHAGERVTVDLTQPQ